MRGFTVFAWLVASPAIAMAQQPAARSIQQNFDNATALHDAKNFSGALAAWEALEARVAKNPRSVAIVRVRKSATLMALARPDDAVSAARAGLATLPANDPSLREDRYNAFNHLAQIAETSLDYASAVDAYRQAEGIALTPALRVAALRGLVETETFVDPQAAMADMARLETVSAPLTIDAQGRSILLGVKSQLLMNRGDFAKAQAEAARAVKLLGGLTTKTDLFDVAARSNYAIAALLAGKAEAAREYMAYTGAGRLPKGEFRPAGEMRVPDCGGEAGLKPNDLAVIEFSIEDDGSVSATPIYAAGGGAVALEFARAVRGWSFDPAQIKDLPPFFRQRARVELRCSTGFERPSLGRYLGSELDNWLITKKVAVGEFQTSDAPAGVPRLIQRLAALEAQHGPDALALVPALQAIARNAATPREPTNVFARRSLNILTANAAPPLARLAADTLVWGSAASEGSDGNSYRHLVEAQLQTPPYSEDGQTRAALRLLLADSRRARDRARTRALLEQAAAEPGLAANHPLRVGALIRLASLEYADGKPAEARAAFDQSGLAANQCALVDAPPKHLRSGGTFPVEALRWGFEGWTQVQFDIGADGKPVNERTLVAYPPFVFTDGGRAVVRASRFEKSFRPDGGLGCGGTIQRVSFRIPE